MILEVLANKINQEKEKSMKMERADSQEFQLSFFTDDINIHGKPKGDSIERLLRIVDGAQQRVSLPSPLY